MTAATAAQMAEERLNGKDDPPTPFPLVWFADAAREAVVQWLVKGIAEQGSMGAFFGASGSGKSFLALLLALAVVRGLPWFGRRTAAGPVLYVAAEAGNSIRRRIHAYQIAHGLEDSTLHFAHVETAPDLLSDEDAAHIIATAIAMKAEAEAAPVLIVIDTLSRAMSGDDGSGQDMPLFIRSCDRIREATGAAICIVHHTGHSEAQRARGHSSFRAALDWELHIEGQQGTRTATVTKLRDGVYGDRFAFDLESVDLGTDEDGDPVTSCVVEPAEPPPKPNGAGRPISGQAGLALKLLQRAVQEAGQDAAASNHIPAGAKVVKVDLWRSYCDQGGLSDSDKADARRQAFHRCKTALLNRRLIGVWGDEVWLA